VLADADVMLTWVNTSTVTANKPVTRSQRSGMPVIKPLVCFQLYAITSYEAEAQRIRQSIRKQIAMKLTQADAYRA